MITSFKKAYLLLTDDLKKRLRLFFSTHYCYAIGGTKY